MTKPKLILASASIARAALLAGANVTFEIRPAELDEGRLRSSLETAATSIADMALTLATEKAARVSADDPTAYVIGADQMLALGAKRYDKAANLGELRQHLIELRGREHQLLSAMVVLRAGETVFSHVGVARLHMRNFSDAFLDHYLEKVGEEALSLVGGYAIESYGANLFQSIEGEHSVILGLPLMPLLEFLREADMMPQ